MRAVAVGLLTLCGACGVIDGCAGEPLPGDGIPRAQIIEAGAQVRLRSTALAPLAARADPTIRAGMTDGSCVGAGQVGTPAGGTFATGSRYCATNQVATPEIPDACGARNGCNVATSIGPDIGLTAVGGGRVRIHLSLDAVASVPLTGQIVGIGFSCTATAVIVDAPITMDVRLGVDAQTGALTAATLDTNGLSASMLVFSGCAVLNDVAGLSNAIYNAVAVAINESLVAAVDTAVVDLLSTSAPFAARIDTAGLLADAAAGAAALEVDLLTGGAVSTDNGGITFGINLGLNSDADPATRARDTASEPAACAANLAAPDLTMSPWSLQATARETVVLPPSGGMLGSPEADRDVVLGMSERSLDLLGHHLAASGSLCLETGQAQFPHLTTGILSALVPSLLAVGTGEEPLRIVGRPGRAVEVAVALGAGGAARLDATLDDYVIEVFATLATGETRLFTLTLDATVGLEPVVVQNPGERAQLSLLLADVTTAQVRVSDVDGARITEPESELEEVVSSVVDLILPPLVGEVPRAPVATIAGFDLDAVELATLTTNGDFVVLRGDLAALAAPTPPTAAPLTATIEELHVPPMESIRRALGGRPGGMLPRIDVSVPATDARDQPLEWSWRLDHGMWRVFGAQVPVQIADAALAWQGEHTVTLASRVQGTHGPWTPTADLRVTIDSVGPRILTAEIAWDGDVLTVPAVDAVHGRDGLAWAYAPAGGEATEWRDVDTVSRAELEVLAGASGPFVVFVRDPSGNVSSETIDREGAPAGGDGGGCCSAQAAPVGSLMLGLFVVLVLRRPPRASPGCRSRRRPRTRACSIRCSRRSPTDCRRGRRSSPR